MDELKLLINQYCDLKKQIEPLQQGLKVLSEQIKEQVLESGQPVETERAKVTIRKGYTRSSWDNKGLRGYAVVNPEIMQFCTKSTTKPTISIKIL